MVTNCSVFALAQICQNVMIQPSRTYLSYSINSWSMKRYTCGVSTFLPQTQLLNPLRSSLFTPQPLLLYIYCPFDHLKCDLSFYHVNCPLLN